MNLFKTFAAAATAMACCAATALPSNAGSFRDSLSLIDLVKGTGTKVSFNSNSFDPSCEGRAGYYSFVEDEEDVLVVCTSQVDEENPDELWEAIAHETMHIAQACNGFEPVSPAKYHPRLLRELRTLAPHYAKMLVTTYSGEHQLLELEAFWAELQPPETIKQLFTLVCYEQ